MQLSNCHKKSSVRDEVAERIDCVQCGVELGKPLPYNLYWHLAEIVGTMREHSVRFSNTFEERKAKMLSLLNPQTAYDQSDNSSLQAEIDTTADTLYQSVNADLGSDSSSSEESSSEQAPSLTEFVNKWYHFVQLGTMHARCTIVALRTEVLVYSWEPTVVNDSYFRTSESIRDMVEYCANRWTLYRTHLEYLQKRIIDGDKPHADFPDDVLPQATNESENSDQNAQMLCARCERPMESPVVASFPKRLLKIVVLAKMNCIAIEQKLQEEKEEMRLLVSASTIDQLLFFQRKEELVNGAAMYRDRLETLCTSVKTFTPFATCSHAVYHL